MNPKFGTLAMSADVPDSQPDNLIRFRGDDGVSRASADEPYRGPERRQSRVMSDHRKGAALRVGREIAAGVQQQEVQHFKRLPRCNDGLNAYVTSRSDRNFYQMFEDVMTAFDRWWRRVFDRDEDLLFRSERCLPKVDCEDFRSHAFRRGIEHANKALLGQACFVLPEDFFAL